MATCFIIFFLTIKSVQKRTILLYLLPKQGALYCSSGTSAASVLPYSRPSSFSPGLRPGTGVPSPTPVPAFGWDFSAQSRPSAAKLGVSFSLFRHCVYLGSATCSRYLRTQNALQRQTETWHLLPRCMGTHARSRSGHRMRERGREARSVPSRARSWLRTGEPGLYRRNSAREAAQRTRFAAGTASPFKGVVKAAAALSGAGGRG